MAPQTLRSSSKRSIADDPSDDNESPNPQQPSMKRRKPASASPSTSPSFLSSPPPALHPDSRPQTQPAKDTKIPQSSPPRATPSSAPKPTLKLIEETGDLFTCAPGTILVHACNCEGAWGAGVAAQFKTHFPDAYAEYATRCRVSAAEAAAAGAAEPLDALRGKALLVPTYASTAMLVAAGRRPDAPAPERQVFVGCLFTSRRKGRRRRDSRAEILEATGSAMRELMVQVGKCDARYADVGELRMCRINSGLFGVPWEETKAVLESVESDGVVEVVKVISRE